MFRSAAKTFVGCLLCLPLLISAVRYEVRKATPRPRPSTHVEHDVRDLTRDIAGPPASYPVKRASVMKLKLIADAAPFEVTNFDLQGIDLARKQIARGLEKRAKRRHEMDQSFEGLRDLIRDSSDPGIKRFLPVVNRLERSMHKRDPEIDVTYVEGFITDFAPLAVYLENETGLPASVILAQIIVESGWGASNITILKNNVLGIGNCRGEDEFVADVDLNSIERDIPVRCNAGTRAYRFDSIADGVLYYTYLLLENESNARHYGPLRRFIRANRSLARSDPRAYRNRVISLIAASYHDDPEWYEAYLRRMARIVDETGILVEVETSMTVIADARVLP